MVEKEAKQIIKIESAVIIENNLPININSFFKESEVPFKSIKSNATIGSRNNVDEQNYKQCLVEKFSKKKYENFFAKDYPYLYFNSISPNEDFLKLKEKVEFKIDMNTSYKKLMHKSAKDPFKKFTTIVNTRKQKDSKETFNMLLKVKHYFDQIKIKVSCEYFVINETNAKFKITIKEHNYSLGTLTITNKKYSSTKDDVELKYDAVSKKNLLSLCDVNDEQKLNHIIKANSEFIDMFSGDIYAPKKTLIIEDLGLNQKIKVKLFKNNIEKHQFLFNGQLICMNVINTMPDLAHNGIITFYYPFYLINLTNHDLVARVCQKLENLFILYKSCVYSSNDLLINNSTGTLKDFKFTVNSNDYTWSSSFIIPDKVSKNQSHYLKIKSKTPKTTDLNLQIDLCCDSLSTIITVKENKFFHIRVDNQTDYNLYIEQLNCDETKEICISKSMKTYFWSNSSCPQVLVFFKRKGDQFVSLEEIDVCNYAHGSRECVKDTDLGVLRFYITEEKEFTIIKAIQEADPDSQKLNSTTFKLKRFFRESIGLSNYSNILKNRLYGKKPDHSHFQIQLTIETLGISLCDKGPVELFYIDMRNLSLNYNVENSLQAVYKHFNLKMKELQIDTQIDIRYHNVI